MRFGTGFKQGDIVIVPFPFSDLSSAKQRPVLALSNDRYNASTEDIVTCGLTSNLKDSDYSLLVGKQNLSEGDIPTKSRIRVDKIFTIEQSLIRKRIGRINEESFSKVQKEILRLFSYAQKD